LEAPCEVACADAGYRDTVELEKIDQKEIKVIVPSQRQALHEEESPFGKSHFTYDKEQDCSICPEGPRLLCTALPIREKASGNTEWKTSRCAIAVGIMVSVLSPIGGVRLSDCAMKP
jgi:hypothetical protein